MFKLLKNLFKKTEEVNNDQFFNQVEKEIEQPEIEEKDISLPVQNILKILREKRYYDLFLTSYNSSDNWISHIYLDKYRQLVIERIYKTTPTCKTVGIYPAYEFTPTNAELLVLFKELKSSWEKFKNKKNSEARVGIDNILMEYIKD